jgi:thiol-disulfide isomerase/thioredoxin
MFLRLLLSLTLFILGWLIYRAAIRILLRRRLPDLDGFKVGKAAILFFSSPDCEPCKTRQLPAIRQVQSLFPDYLQVFEFDVTERHDLADAWGVLTLPTTFIIDRRGRPRGVNLGVADAYKLAAQLESIDPTIQQ